MSVRHGIKNLIIFWFQTVEELDHVLFTFLKNLTAGALFLLAKLLFVNACYLLCRRIVTRDQVNEADDLLNKFSLRLYGPEHDASPSCRMYL